MEWMSPEWDTWVNRVKVCSASLFHNITMDAPFTDEELASALRLLSLDRVDVDVGTSEVAIGWSYTDDTLIALSLQSRGLAERVQAYRAERGAIPAPGSSADRAWARRCTYVEPLIR